MSKTLIQTESGRRLCDTKVAKSINTTLQNAKSLRAQGYTIHAVDAPNGLFYCQKPLPLEPGEDGVYQVDVFNQTCDCWQWRRSKSELGRGFCKHLSYTSREVERSLRILGLWPGMMSLDEAAHTYSEEINNEF